ncbi:hinge connector of long tail fiber distal connector [Aeromonas phage ZPAH1]|nr:hinge connector of long tail fiber distal connector [Aeromonas phage ZPAH1]
MADLKSSSTAGGGLVWTQTNLPFSPQDIKLFYDGKEIIDNTNNQTIGGNKNFTGTLTYKTPSSSNEVAIKSYVDGLNSTSVKSVNGTLPIVVTTGVNPTVSINNATQSAHGAMSKEDKVKLDGLPVRAVNRDGDTMTGNLGLVNLTATGMVTATTGLINADADYGQRMVLSGSTGYFQSGKKDRNLDDQRMMFSGYLGVPLSYSATMMKDGVNPIVRWGSASYDILHRGNLPSAEDIKAMAVYDRPTGDDCNNATMPGNYGIFANTANTPFGSGPSGSTLLVTKWGNGANAQIFFSYTSDRVFIRRQYIGVWQAWTEVYTSANKQPVGGMGLGVGDSPNAITVTGGVRDFNLVKTTGVFTVDGNWSNGIDNSPTASTHTGMVEVKQRAFDNMTIQTFYYHVNVADLTTQRAFTRIWQNASTGWSPWIPTGVWEQVNTYRTGVLRHNNSTNDDSVYPYVSYTKEKYRDGVAAGVAYTIGELGFRAGTTNRYDPHSADLLARIIGQAENTTTAGEYEGRLFLASRYRRGSDGSTGDTSTLVLSRATGAEFTHAGQKVKLNTGEVTANKFIAASAGYALQYANNSQQGIYFDNRTIIGGSSVGTDGVIIRPNGSGTITGETTFNANGTISNNQAPTLAMHLTNKAYVDSVALGGFSSIITLKDTDNLNDIKTAGIYSQVANAKALTSLNYPVQKAGNLIVTTSAGVIQKYWVYNSSEVWSRAQYSTGGWRPWYRDYNEEFKPTSADVGALSLTGGTLTGDVRFNSGNTTRLSLGSGSDYYIERSPSGLTLASGTINPMVIVGGQTGIIYSTLNKPTAADVGTLTTSQINTELGKKLNLTGGTMTGAIRWDATDEYINAASNNMYVAAKSGTVYLEGSSNPIVRIGSTDYTMYHTGNKPTADDVGTLTTSQINTELGKKLNLTGGTMTGAIVSANIKNAIRVDNQSSISFQEGANARFHILTESNTLRIKHGDSAQNPILQISTSTMQLQTQLNVRSAMYVNGEDGTKLIGLGAPESSEINPYIYVRRTGDTGNIRVMTFDQGEIIANQDRIAAPTFRVINNAGLQFTPNSNRSGLSWGMGMDWSTGTLGIHKYQDGVWQLQPLQINSSGVTSIHSLVVNNNTEINGSLGVNSGYVSVISNSNNRLEFHRPGFWATMIYMNTNGDLRFVSSNGAGGETNARMVLSTTSATFTGTVSSAGAIYEGGQRVYSPNNPQPMNATNVGVAMANLPYDAVGQYALMTTAVDIGQRGPGFETAGSNLRWVTAEGNNISSIVPPGVWRLLGFNQGGATFARWTTSLWQRVR